MDRSFGPFALGTAMSRTVQLTVALVAIFAPLSSTAQTAAGRMAEESWPRHASVLVLEDGRVIVAGGMYWDYPNQAAWRRAYAEACEGVHIPNISVRNLFVWRPDRRTWSRSRPLQQPRSMAGAVNLTGNEVLVVGGEHFHYSWEPVTIRRSVERVRASGRRRRLARIHPPAGGAVGATVTAGRCRGKLCAWSFR